MDRDLRGSDVYVRRHRHLDQPVGHWPDPQHPSRCLVAGRRLRPASQDIGLDLTVAIKLRTTNRIDPSPHPVGSSPSHTMPNRVRAQTELEQLLPSDEVLLRPRDGEDLGERRLSS
jgi:hypothetical protein